MRRRMRMLATGMFLYTVLTAWVTVGVGLMSRKRGSCVYKAHVPVTGGGKLQTCLL